MARPRLAALLGLLLTLTLAPRGRADPGDPALGETRLTGGVYFQWLGRDDAGRGLWLYPHLDGTLEVFADPGEGAWEGALESRFDPATGSVARRFSAAEALNEAACTDLSRARRRRAAATLALALALRPAGDLPYYLGDAPPLLERLLDDDDRAAIASAAARLAGYLARVPSPGTRVLSLPATLRDADDHWQALLADGYLDIAIVGGNSHDDATGKTYSWSLFEELRAELARRGLALSRFREAEDETLAEVTRTIHGTPVRVRIQCTGASQREARVRRNVANFVEGLARADVLVFVGHSNHASGAYYLAEDRSRFSCFRVGLENQGIDLARKCYGLGQRAHQVLVLQSCSSFPKCRPIRAFYEDQVPGPAPGVVGTAAPLLFEEFVPRTCALVEALLGGAGPRVIAARLAASGDAASPAFVQRGVLQAQRSFIVPRGVTIGAFLPQDERLGFLVTGAGSDGETYCSSEVFPQDTLGEVVQVAPFRRGLYGLLADGQLLRVGPETGGAARPSGLAPGRTFRFVTDVPKRRGPDGLLLIASDGEVLRATGIPPRLVRSRAQPPSGVRFVAIGVEADERLVAADEAGAWFGWRDGVGRWESLDAPPAPRWAPTLRPGPAQGDLWLPEF